MKRKMLYTFIGLTTAIIFVAGCGSGQKSPSEVWQKYVKAVQNGNKEEMLSYLSSKMKKKLKKRANIKATMKLHSMFERAEPASQDIDGNEAKLKIKKQRRRGPNTSSTAKLIKEGGSWKINYVSVTPGRPGSGGYNEQEGRLNLGNMNITDKKLNNLQDYDPLKRLTLDKSDITDEGLKHLQDLGDLQSLSLNKTDITDEGLKHLQGLNNLKRLNLNNTDITGAGLKYLKDLDKLDKLSLNKTDITDDELKHLEDLDNMTILNLENTNITDSGLEHLPNCDNMSILNLKNTDVTDEAVKKLEENVPEECVVHH